MKGKGADKGKAPVGKGGAYLSLGAEQLGKGSGNKGGLQVKAAPGPGAGVTRAAIKRDVWDQMGKTWVLEFYGHHQSQKYGCFSNFYFAPFEFVVPAEFCAFPLSLRDRTIACDFSEKAIMLCKAAAMGDFDSYNKIATSNADPALIKRMGKEVRGFSQDIWCNIECSVAFEVVYQKFSKVDTIRSVLLSTEDWVLAEATKNDQNWGIGIDKGDYRVNHPKQWQGTNMLGWALMEARETLRATPAVASGAAPDPASSASAGVPDTSKSQSTSVLSEQEKAFLKIVKKIRDVLKLEGSKSYGEVLDKTQANKLAGKKRFVFGIVAPGARIAT